MIKEIVAHIIGFITAGIYIIAILYEIYKYKKRKENDMPFHVL